MIILAKIKDFFSTFLQFFLSGYTFYFRWPVFRVKEFHPAAIFLGPVLQAAVFAAFYLMFTFFLPENFLRSSSFPLLASFMSLSAITGFFHEDGWADSADSLGVPKFSSSAEQLDKIHHAMKDSRLGAFGVSALICLWLIRLSALFLVERKLVSVVVIIFLSRYFGLCGAWIVARLLSAKKFTRNSHLMLNVGVLHPLLWGVIGLVLCKQVAFVGGMVFSMSLFVTLFCFYLISTLFIYAISLRSAGLSGDLIGAAIILCECLMLIYV